MKRVFELIFDRDVSVGKGQRSECVTQMPPDLRVKDFGFLPRDRYPLVAVLTLANTEDRDAYDIVSNMVMMMLVMMEVVMMMMEVMTMVVVGGECYSSSCS